MRRTMSMRIIFIAAMAALGLAVVISIVRLYSHRGDDNEVAIPSTNIVIAIPPSFRRQPTVSSRHDSTDDCQVIYAYRDDSGFANIAITTIHNLHCLIGPDSALDRQTGWASIPISAAGQILYEHYMSPLSLSLGIDYDINPPVIMLVSVGSPNGFSDQSTRILVDVAKSIRTFR